MIKIEMPYFRDLSVNYYKIVGKGGRKTPATKPEVKKWMTELTRISREKAHAAYGNEFGSFIIPLNLYPINVEVHGYFKDERVPDLDNLAKVILDALKVGIVVDDKHMRYVAGGYETGYDEPRLEIEVGI